MEGIVLGELDYIHAILQNLPEDSLTLIANRLGSENSAPQTILSHYRNQATQEQVPDLRTFKQGIEDMAISLSGLDTDTLKFLIDRYFFKPHQLEMPDEISDCGDSSYLGCYFAVLNHCNAFYEPVDIRFNQEQIVDNDIVSFQNSFDLVRELSEIREKALIYERVPIETLKEYIIHGFYNLSNIEVPEFIINCKNQKELAFYLASIETWGISPLDVEYQTAS